MAKINSPVLQISWWQTHPSPLPGRQHPHMCRSLATVSKQKPHSFAGSFAWQGSIWVAPPAASVKERSAKMETWVVISLGLPILTPQRWVLKHGCFPPSRKTHTLEKFTWQREVSLYPSVFIFKKWFIKNKKTLVSNKALAFIYSLVCCLKAFCKKCWQ